MDYPNGDSVPNQIADEAAYSHQGADLPEGGAGNAVADHQHIAQGGEEADKRKPDTLALQEMLHVADLGLLDPHPMFYPIESGITAYHVVGRSPQPVAHKNPYQRGPCGPSQGYCCTQGRFAAHRDATASYEAAKGQSRVSPCQYIVHVMRILGCKNSK